MELVPSLWRFPRGAHPFITCHSFVQLLSGADSLSSTGSKGERVSYKIYLGQGWPGSGIRGSSTLTKQRATEAIPPLRIVI